MNHVRIVKVWDKHHAQFVEIPIAEPPDKTLACEFCRYYEDETGMCRGLGSRYFGEKIPFPHFTPRLDECEVRLPPELCTYS
ncbi:hypothetical protein EU520_00260 [Candidatus Thorarchaeota archaeon]|nr:MAG: hypothetical protein EU520_00260 [Candidatus Thorarchaeota archaeon]